MRKVANQGQSTGYGWAERSYKPFRIYWMCQFGSIPFDFGLYNRPKLASTKWCRLLWGEVGGRRWLVEAHQVDLWCQTSLRVTVLVELRIECQGGCGASKLANYVDKTSRIAVPFC
jgi:hypothetical protein